MAAMHQAPTIVARRPLREFAVEANNGIISTAGIVEGMMAADVRNTTVVISAVIALVVGTVAAAAARFTDAAYQRDAALSAVADTESRLLAAPARELADLVTIYQEKGLSLALAEQVAEELSRHDALGAHVEDELDLEEEDFISPWWPAGLSAVAFAAGGVLPLVLSIFIPGNDRLLVTGAAVTLALVITSYVGARVAQTPPLRTVLRTVTIGVATLALAALVGSAF